MIQICSRSKTSSTGYVANFSGTSMRAVQGNFQLSGQGKCFLQIASIISASCARVLLNCCFRCQFLFIMEAGLWNCFSPDGSALTQLRLLAAWLLCTRECVWRCSSSLQLWVCRVLQLLFKCFIFVVFQ